jgi:hypothetical protein
VEQTLTFLVEARGAFSKLDPVLAHLVVAANAVAMRVYKLF